MRQHIFKLRMSDVYLLITLQKVASYGSFSWSYHKIPRYHCYWDQAPPGKP